LSIAIVGCGIGGLAGAIALARRGHTVTAFERAATPGPAGAGILIQPIGAVVLGRLGVRAPLEQLAARVTRLHGVTVRGRSVLDLSYADLRADLHGLGVHRGLLFALLASAAREAGVSICTGAEVSGIDHERGIVVMADGASHGPFDLVVVADGARSRLRGAVFPWARERTYPYGALWFVARDSDGSMQGTLAQTYAGTRKMLGLMPTGRIAPEASPTVSVFWGVRMDEVDRLRSRGVAAWRAEALAMRPSAAGAIDQITDLDQMIAATYTDAWVRPCYRSRVVVIGDAAHAMSPQLGQGANIALVDAECLAGCIGECASVPEALARFDRARADHWRFYSWVTRLMTPFFQSDLDVVAPVRDIGLPMLWRMGWSRRELLRTLCGVKRGVMRSDPVPE
jgi:2-polyprenyl-6-methoxyphenol hydroxylase-like FAD-dependent oxidoreductase